MTMQNKPLQEFYKLIEQEQYRDALGVLESEEIEPQIADKWRAWLESLHKEERVMAGVASPKLLTAPNQRFYEHAKLIWSVLGMPLFTVMFFGLMGVLFTTQSMWLFVTLIALVGSYVGWKWTVELFVHENTNEITATLWIALIIYTFFSLPRQIWNVDLSGYFVVIGVVYLLPFTLHMGWRLGEKYGLKIAKWWRPEMALEDGEKK